MMRTFLAFLLCTTAVPAIALDFPQPGTADTHMRTVKYNPLNRTRVVGQIGRATTITFDKGEQIVGIVFGQDGLWDGPDPKDLASQPLKNILPLWPRKTQPTNLQVTTVTPDGVQKPHQFALVAVETPATGEDQSEAVFGLAFTSQPTVTPEQVTAWRERKRDVEVRKASDRLATDFFYGQRNWAYTSRPNKAWRLAAWPKPDVSDNGMLSGFRFVGNVSEPAIYIVDNAGDPRECLPGGEERLAPFSNDNGLKIVHTVQQHYRLRLGEAVMEVCNNSWDHGVGQNPGTGTTSPEVFRSVISAKN